MTDYKVPEGGWMCGKLPEEWQRPEIKQLKEAGYEIVDPFEAVHIFETKIAKYAGSKYAVAVDNCTDAIFLSLEYLKYIGVLNKGNEITIPNNCYLSIPMAIKHAGLKVKFEPRKWKGVYQLKPVMVIDGATRFTKNMYTPHSFQCLSFQIKKRLPIGKGGMILTDDEHAYKWFKEARYEARHLEIPQWDDKFDFCGWNMYMAPEDAARGILIFDQLPKVNEDTGSDENYPDLSKQKVFK